jgi:hypothetical protein
MPPKMGSSSEAAKQAVLIAQKKGSRYLEGEDEISKDPFYSIEYARTIGRFEKGEPIIATDPKLSAYYAIKILRGRFLLGERAIAQSAYYTCAYCVYILKGEKVEEIHHAMLKKGITESSSYWVREYCRYMEHVEGKGEKPYWADESAAINWF